MKTYVGNAKEVTTQYGPLMKVSFSKKDLAILTANLNENGYVNLQVSKRREVSEYGHTHSISIDDWVPTKPKATQVPAETSSAPVQQPAGFDIEEDLIPF